MKVRPISITKPLIQEEFEGQASKEMTAEELIVYIARVSSNQRTEGAVKLIRYLINHKHWSPFEQANLCVEVITSRAIAQQIIRHWSLSVQEFSQRYAEVTDFEPVQLRRQAVTNRQSSTEEFNPSVVDYITGNTVKADKAIQDYLDQGQILYKRLLEGNVAKECARMILPLTTQTKMYLNGSVRDWIHYLGQRTTEHTQLEHRQIAIEIDKIFSKYFPNIYEAIQLLGDE
jgi:thymidylate synthase (FAD)